ncbi:efflux RND transporter periplasmic adaptor subunit [Marivirga lumbricoides]|uniref:Efflux RND transporter periplasmic adaptor subunit n=1 Tax=Marivirga lumbricoides TaxID=1046115 RepID=A0A2T4DU30_9BACT|nr:efflux RND transporter periplasmic adaptor subunit [Marivirga lumbricoides]
MKRKLISILPFVAMMACSSNEQAKELSESNIKNQQFFNVRTAKVLPNEGRLSLKYSGVVEASETTPVSFATAGTVTEVLVAEGQSVRKGQVLAKLDMAGPKNRHQLAVQQQQRAQDAYNRMKPMQENGTLPEIKWVEVETGLEQTTTAVAIAQQGIDDCYLYAPKSGIIGSKSITPGMNILPTAKVMDLVDIQTVYVKIPVPENEVSIFQKGQEATIKIGALDRKVSGQVKEVGVSADFISHTYPVKIEVSNTDLTIKPGMVCEVATHIPSNNEGVLVSNKAVQIGIDGNQYVMVLQNGKVGKRMISITTPIDEYVMVREGLKVGEEVITDGQQKLESGMSVNVIR